MLGGVGWLLFVLFVALPFVDLVLLLRVGDLLGFWPTVLLTLGMGALGAWLSKREGLRVWRAWTQALAELRTHEQGIIDGVLVIAGGALLMAPGVLTDVVGFAFLIPLSRRWIARGVRAAIDRRIRRGQVRIVQSSFVSIPFESPESPASGPPGVVDTTGESVGEPPDDPKSLRAKHDDGDGPR